MGCSCGKKIKTTTKKTTPKSTISARRAAITRRVIKRPAR